ncbi:MAG: hypothetical protein ACHQDB_09870 [Steroidobacterales bacterium]
MRYRSSSSLSYRNVLIAAALAAALGVVTGHSKPGTGIDAQPQRDRQTPDGSVAPASADSGPRGGASTLAG